MMSLLVVRQCSVAVLQFSDDQFIFSQVVLQFFFSQIVLQFFFSQDVLQLLYFAVVQSLASEHLGLEVEDLGIEVGSGVFGRENRLGIGAVYQEDITNKSVRSSNEVSFTEAVSKRLLKVTAASWASKLPREILLRTSLTWE